ncbi:hypothetical protein GC197_13085 [bacterium]|nr:hypothetical protein [bacterium]
METEDPFAFEDESRPLEEKIDSRVTLSLIDLIAAVTAAAIISALGSLLLDKNEITPAIAISLTGFVLYATLGATALFLFGRRWLLGVPTDFQPGHWLLCLSGILFIGQVFSFIVNYYVMTHFIVIRGPASSAFAWTIALTTLIASGSYVIAGFLMPVRPAWRLLLIPSVMSVAMTIVSISGLSFLLHWWPIAAFNWFVVTFAPILLLIALTIWDRVTTSDHRDVIHWVGVATNVVAFGVVLIPIVASLLGVW